MEFVNLEMFVRSKTYRRFITFSIILRVGNNVNTFLVKIIKKMRFFKFYLRTSFPEKQ
jgi:hypothetical protein